MTYLCDHTINSVNTSEKSTHFLNKNLKYEAAYNQCADKADGRDFSPDSWARHAVCHVPGQVLRYKADEDRLSDNLRVLLN